MKADIRTIKLCRKAIGKDSFRANESQAYFSTDYFNFLYEEQVNEENSLEEITGIWQENTRTSEITVQSYALYCSEAVLKVYEAKSKSCYRGNPFDRNGMRFLSIIQIHITPEILARMGNDEKNMIWNQDPGIIMQPFVEDIYDTLDLFHDKWKKELFIARVYLMLSAGDFAVVVRSQRPETSYYISTYLRRKIAQCRETDKTFVLYKTYTLLSMENLILGSEEERSETGNCFVIRGCYSNKYWSEQKTVQDVINTHKIADMNTLRHLNGRYDFTLELSEEDFFEVMPYIIGEKSFAEENVGEDWRLTDYIKYLLKKGYLSYVNERYLVQTRDAAELSEQDFVSKSVYIKQAGAEKQEIYEKNQRQIEQLLDDYKSIEGSAFQLKGYRKKIRQYLFLIKKQIELCKCINKLSDTRIYAGVFAEQLETIVKTAGIYLDLCKEEQAVKNGLMNLLEEYLRKAIVALDQYAGYIRNNNLQSLQTPNYNIESNMGMDKFLIGYSELLREFMKYYRRKMGDDIAGKSEYLPVVVPDMHDGDVSVEILFPAGNGMDYTNEEQSREEKDINKYLMVVGSATLAEVSDMPVMISALFHEVAHQFRYEERAMRNDAILEVIVKEYMSQVAERIMKTIQQEIGVEDSCTSLYIMLREALTEACLRVVFGKTEDGKFCYPYQNVSWEYFERGVGGALNNLISAWTRRTELQERVREFVNQLRYHRILDSKEFTELLGEMQHKLHEIENAEDEIQVLNNNEEKLCQMAGALVHFLYIPSNDVPFFEGCDKKNYACIWKEYKSFCMWINGYIMERRSSIGERDIDTKCFQKELDCVMREWWEKVNEQSKRLYDIDGDEIAWEECRELPEYRQWALVGRYLGLDYKSDENQEKFQKELTRVVSVSGEISDKEMTSLDIYREMTADLFMCSAMNLSPFAYLNLAAVLFIRDRCVTDGAIERLFWVLYVKWCGAEEKPEEKYREMCCNIHKKWKEYVGSMVQYCKEQGVELASGECWPTDICWKNQTESAREAIYKIMEDECTDIKNWIEKLDNDKEFVHKDKVIGQFQNALRIYDTLTILIEQSPHLIMEVSENAVLLADLLRGKNALENFYEKMKAENPLEEPLIAEFRTLAETISDFLEKTYTQSGVHRDASLNCCCMEFLLKMYYSNKIRKAQED